MTVQPLPPNPKQIFGDKKPPLDEFPMSALIEASLAGLDGDLKYGFRNWLDLPVEARTYIKGALRHIQLWANGEERTRDSNVHNLGAAIAGLGILIDAQVNGKLIDNRAKSPANCDLLHSAEANVAFLQELDAKRRAQKAAAAAPSPEPVASSAGPDTPETSTPVAPAPLGDERPEPIPEGVVANAEDEYKNETFFREGVCIDTLDSRGLDLNDPMNAGSFWSIWHRSVERFPRRTPTGALDDSPIGRADL